MSAAPCKECGVRPKVVGRHRCIVCQTRQAPIGDQVNEARRRLGMVPEELRRKTVPARDWPAGQRWCASCQSFVDLADVPKGGSRCKACTSAATHAARTEKVYGLTAAEYDRLLAAQGGKCAICRARPKSKRLAVDHDHKTGAVRGLLCSRCNHDLMGSAWDSSAMALALWHYMNTPPTSGNWRAPELGLVAPVVEGEKTPSKTSGDSGDLFAVLGENAPRRPGSALGEVVSLPTVEEARVLPLVELMRLVQFLKEQEAEAPF